VDLRCDLVVLQHWKRRWLHGAMVSEVPVAWPGT
jgi:hypothetical protein